MRSQEFKREKGDGKKGGSSKKDLYSGVGKEICFQGLTLGKIQVTVRSEGHFSWDNFTETAESLCSYQTLLNIGQCIHNTFVLVNVQEREKEIITIIIIEEDIIFFIAPL